MILCCVSLIRCLTGWNAFPELSVSKQNFSAHRHRFQSANDITESFVIAFDQKKATDFIERNHHADLDPVLWVLGVDGFHQKHLDVWAQLLPGGEKPLNASAFTAEHKGEYASPHAVGCYLAHWNLLRSLAHRPIQLRPAAYLIFEDDAGCAPNLVPHVLETMRQLPQDWDILFIGGKPFSSFKNPVDVSAVLSRATCDDGASRKSSPRTLRRDICRGDFGLADGPLAPDGSRLLSEYPQQACWQTKSHTNADACVVNPQRLDHLLGLLQPVRYAPIDIVLADHILENKIKSYMTTRMWCVQQPKGQTSAVLESPTTWEGYFAFQYEPIVKVHPGLQGQQHVWQLDLRLENCTY